MRKLFAAGFLLLSLCVLGLSTAVPSASAARWYCGTKCNGMHSSTPIASNGVQCNKSQKVVSSGSFYTADLGQYSGDDPAMNVKVLYSPVCQTMWVSVSNTGRKFISCSLEIYNDDGKMYRPACPAAGKTVYTVMVNDHSPSYGKYATFGAYESIHSVAMAHFYSGYDYSY